jgi:hypothetical protein
VERFAIGAECAYAELTLRGTLGGRPISWRVCDRATLRDGLVVERESYFDPTPLLRAILTRPRAWPALARAWHRSRRQPQAACARADVDLEDGAGAFEAKAAGGIAGKVASEVNADLSLVEPAGPVAQ